MAVSPCTALCSADARAATRSTSTGSLRSATNAQRLSFAGTLVRVLEPPVKDSVNQVRMLYGFMGCIGKKGATYAACFRDLMNDWGVSRLWASTDRCVAA